MTTLTDYMMDNKEAHGHCVPVWPWSFSESMLIKAKQVKIAVFGILGIVVVVTVSYLAFIAYVFWPPNVRALGNEIMLDKGFREVEAGDLKEGLAFTLYCFDKLEYNECSGIDPDDVNVINSGRAPGIRVNGDNYIVLYKWKNFVSGVVIPDARLERDDTLYYEAIDNGRYYWHWDPENK